MGFTVFTTFVLADFLFLAGGALLMGFALIEQAEVGENPTKANVVRNLLLVYSPSTAAIVNAVGTFIAFVVSIPGLVFPSTRGWLKLFAVLVLGNALFTMIMGLTIWFHTLRTRSEFSSIWAAQSHMTQSFLQQSLDCCGYESPTSPPFVVDTTCTSAAVASMLGGCISSFSSEANLVLDQIFTAAFAICGVDFATFMAILMLLQDRKEKERYRHIDEKNGNGGF